MNLLEQQKDIIGIQCKQLDKGNNDNNSDHIFIIIRIMSINSDRHGIHGCMHGRMHSCMYGRMHGRMHSCLGVIISLMCLDEKYGFYSLVLNSYLTRLKARKI